MSTANSLNSHAGLSFGGLNNSNAMRQGRAANQGYQPPQPKQPVLAQQHPTPYQHYPPHQPQQSYAQLYNTPNPSPVQHAVQNGSRAQQPQLPPVPNSRPRSTSHRQIPAQPSNSSLGYIPTTMAQHMSQQPMDSQSMSQQPLSSQPMGQQQSMGPRAMPQQPINQNSMSQQQMNQQAISQQAINHQQSMAQDNSMMSQPTPPHTHHGLTPQPPAQPQPQQPTPQPPPPQQSHTDGSMQHHEAQHDDAMDAESVGESGEDGGEAKNTDVTYVPRPPLGAMMSAPPKGGSFATLEAVHKYVLDYCTSVGYAVVIGRSKKTVPGLKKVLFVCDRAGKPPKKVVPEQRKRKTSSRKCDCQFGFFAIEQRTQWTVRYRPDDKHLKHNHGPSDSPMLHPAARKLDSKMVATVKELKEQGTYTPSSRVARLISPRRFGSSNSGDPPARQPQRALVAQGHLQCTCSYNTQSHQGGHRNGGGSARHLQQASSKCRRAAHLRATQRACQSQGGADQGKGGQTEENDGA